MKIILLSFIFSIPYFLMAQKGVIKPDFKPVETTNVVAKSNNLTMPNDFKLWIIDGNLVNCIDTVTKCYVVKENGIHKIIPQEDLYDFIYEEGYKYTIMVKEELKTPPVTALSGIYNYILVKIVSKKSIDKTSVTTSNSYTEIPVVKKEDKTTEIPINTETSTVNNQSKKTTFVNVSEQDSEAGLREDVSVLKKQIRELKKQVDVMQLIIDMQLQLIQKK